MLNRGTLVLVLALVLTPFHLVGGLLPPPRPPSVRLKGTSSSSETFGRFSDETSYQAAIAELKIYHATSENLILPRDHPLSKVVYSYDWWKRHVKNRQERVKELNDLGFVWERLQSDWNIALESLVCFKVSREDIFGGLCLWISSG